jgi:hypothetical protein
MKWLCFSLAVMACGGTSRTRTTFPVEVAAVGREGLTTDSGWAVTLTKATVSLGAVRFFTGKVLIGRRFDPWSMVWSTAWAHPGHYQQGEAVGELVQNADIDLLEGPVAWGTANAVTGDYGSMQLTYAAQGLRLAGFATKAGQRIDFEATTMMPAKPLEGIAFDRVMTTEKGVVRVAFDFNVILSRVDFSAIGMSAAPLDPASPAANGLNRGLLDTTAYRVTFDSL